MAYHKAVPSSSPVVLADMANVKDSGYGAVGDGATDDTDAIQKAIDASNHVYIPSGVYMVRHDATSISIPGITMNLGLKIIDATKIELAPDATLQMIGHATTLSSLLGITGTGAEICGGTISGDKYTHSGVTGEWGHCIYVFSGVGTRIHDITLQRAWGYGIFLGEDIGGENNQHIRVDRITAVDNRGHGLGATSLEDSLITNSFFYSNTGLTYAVGVDLEAGSANEIRNVSVVGNVFSNNQGSGFVLNGARGDNATRVVIANNHSYGNGLYGFAFGTNSVAPQLYISVAGNTSQANAWDGIRTTNNSYSSFVNNQLIGNTKYGFRADSLTFSEIVGNVAAGNTVADSIFDVSCTDNDVVHNINIV